MAFSWTTVNDGTVITAAQWNEVKTNADTVISNLGIAPYGWSELPVTQEVDKFEPAEVTDLRDALDYAHDNNTCSAENVAFDSGVELGDDVSVDAGDDITVLIGHKSGNDASDNSAALVGDDGTIRSSYDASINSTRYVTYKSDYNSTVKSGYNSGYN